MWVVGLAFHHLRNGYTGTRFGKLQSIENVLKERESTLHGVWPYAGTAVLLCVPPHLPHFVSRRREVRPAALS